MESHTASAALIDENLRDQLRPGLEALRVLGTGATSMVYLARDLSLQRLVAVKILRPNVAVDETIRLRFEREAQSVARISHPSVPAIYWTGRFDNGLPYFVMEYIDGRNVRDLMAAGRTFSGDEACKLLADVASALAAAHERGIVHRNVQVGNVFIENQTNRVLLTDFGIAALLETGSASAARLTAAGVRIGDIRYMSPEQIRGEPVTEQSDIFSLGILAYEILAGTSPFATRAKVEIARAHLGDAPIPLQQLRPDVDATLAMLFERCLAKHPSQRPAARDLAAALSTPATASAQGGPVAQLMDELRKRRVYRVFAAYSALAIAVLGGAQVVYDAFELPRLSYQILVGATLAGLPAAVVISWLYDVGRGGIQRAKASAETARVSALKWVAFGTVVGLVALLGWLLLK